MKRPARMPAERSMADVYAQTDPLPLVPAMWIAFQVKVLSWIRRLMRARPGEIMSLFYCLTGVGHGCCLAISAAAVWCKMLVALMFMLLKFKPDVYIHRINRHSMHIK